MKIFIFIILVFPFITYSAPIMVYGKPPGERILAAAQTYGMTDSELTYFLENTNPDLTVIDSVLGANALIHAALNNRPNMVRLLLDKGKMNKNEVDKNGETALIGASKKGHIEVVKILLDYEADKNIQGTFKKTAYQYSMENGHKQVAELLKSYSPLKKKFKQAADLALYINKFKPSDQLNPVGKIKEIEKIVGVPDDINKKRLAREAVEKWKKVAGNKKKARAAELNKILNELPKTEKVDFRFTEKDLAPIETPKKFSSPYIQGTLPEVGLKERILKLAEHRDNRIKNEEEKLRLKNQKEQEEAAKERIKKINQILFTGTKNKNVQEIDQEPVEVQNAKVESIQSLLDTDEKPQEKNIQFKMATKRINLINRFNAQPQVLKKEILATENEEKELMDQTDKKIKMEEEKKKAELQKQESSDLYQLVQTAVKVQKFVDNSRKGKKNALALKEILPEWNSNKTIMIFPDFKLKMLTKLDCILKQNETKKWFLFINKLSFSDVLQTSRNSTLWFINKEEENPTEKKECLPGKCWDFPIFAKSYYGNKDLTLNKITINYGDTYKNHFNIYSPLRKAVIRIPITVCEGYPRK